MIGGVILYVNKKRNDEIEKLRELVYFVREDYNAFIYEHEDYSEEKALKVFFSSYANKEKAFLERIKANEKEKQKEDERRKRKIINRVFSYNYEETIYEIFSTKAILLDEYPKGNPTFSTPYLSVDYVVDEMARLLGISDSASKALFLELAKKKILYLPVKKDNNGKNYIESGKCGIGDLLLHDWDVISKYDLNFNRWMATHQNSSSK